MNENLKYIHIGSLIQIRIEECAIDVTQIAHSLDMSTKELKQLFERSSISSGLLLRFCKMLAYDFFRIYTQHLILYAPQEEKMRRKKVKVKIIKTKTSFVKNVYTQEVINYLMEVAESGRKSYRQLSEEYNSITKWKLLFPECTDQSKKARKKKETKE